MAAFPIPPLQLNPALISFLILAVYFIFGFLVGKFLGRHGTLMEVIYGLVATLIGMAVLAWLGFGWKNIFGVQIPLILLVFLALFFIIGARLKSIPKLEIILIVVLAFIFWAFLTKSLTFIKWLPALGSGVRLPGQALASTALNINIPSVFRTHLAMTLLGLILGIILKPKKEERPYNFIKL